MSTLIRILYPIVREIHDILLLTINSWPCGRRSSKYTCHCVLLHSKMSMIFRINLDVMSDRRISLEREICHGGLGFIHFKQTERSQLFELSEERFRYRWEMVKIDCASQRDQDMTSLCDIINFTPVQYKATSATVCHSSVRGYVNMYHVKRHLVKWVT